MADDYLDNWRSLAEKTTGETPEQIDDGIPVRFALFGLHKRAAMLAEIDRSMSKGDLEEEDIRSAMSKADLRHRLGEIHDQLRKRGR
jgi:hypothetical protein